MRKIAPKTLTLSTAIAFGLLATAAQAEPVTLTAQQMDQVTAGQLLDLQIGGGTGTSTVLTQTSSSSAFDVSGTFTGAGSSTSSAAAGATATGTGGGISLTLGSVPVVLPPP